MSGYEPELTLREARARHFARSGFSEAGYAARFVRFRAGWVSVWLPNTKGRVRALRYHDLHHVLTEYDVTWRGEAEIAAWELASGCGRHLAAWVLNFGALGIGLVLWPGAVYSAYARGRRCTNLYAWPFTDELLSRTVGDVREELGLAS